MFGNAKNGSVPLGKTQMSYVSFGSGEKNLIILPGLSDGPATVRGKAQQPIYLIVLSHHRLEK